MQSGLHRPLLIVALVVTAGCAGPSASGSSTTSTPEGSAAFGGSPAPSPTVDEAKQRAQDAERSRVGRVLENATSLTDVSVGVYGSSGATVLGRNDSGVRVRVEMSYSYGYDCDGRVGHVDAQTTTVVYRVTADRTSLVRVEEDVRNICE